MRPCSYRPSTLLRVVTLAAMLSLAGTWATASIHVAPPPAGSDVTGDGTDVLPFATIQHAYHMTAVQGETILVQPGTYLECIDATGDLVDIGGGVLELKWVNIVAASVDPAATTIQCNGVLTTIKIGGFGGLLDGFTITGGGDSGVLGVGTVTITGNVVTGNSGDEGGGISTKPESCIYGDTLTTVTDNVVTSNTASTDGGGIFVFTGQDLGGCQGGDTLAIVQGNTVESNLAIDDGGGLEAQTESELGFLAAVTVEDNVFRNNSTVGSNGYGGGSRAIAFGDGTDRITVRDNTFEANVSGADGGGLSAWIDAKTEADHIVLVENNTVVGNEAQFVGGGLDLFLLIRQVLPDQSYSMIGRRNTVIGNFSYGNYFGGGIVAEYEIEETLETDMALAEFKVTENLIRFNSADLHGGGLSIGSYVNTSLGGYPVCLFPANPGSATIEATHNLVIENYAEGQAISDGGGLVVDLEGCTNGTAAATVAFNTIAANEAVKDAGGVMVFAKTRDDLGGRTELDLNHNIVSDNNEWGIKGPADNPGIYDLIIEYNNFFNNANGNYRIEIGDRTGVDGNVSVNPLYVNPSEPDYHLSPGSGVIDLGSPYPGGLPLTDVDGDPRFVDGDGDGQTAADMGHDEYFVCDDVDHDGYGGLLEPGDTCSLDNCPDDYNPNQVDCDDDGLGDACDPDTVDGDGDGVDELCDPDDTDPTACADADADGCDDCSSGVFNPYDDGVDLDLDGICAVGDSDDGDPNACFDLDGDNCDDCTNGSADPFNDGADFDGDGVCDLTDPDDDDDGVEDPEDSDPLNQNVCRDVDADTCDDCTNGSDDPADDGPDFDGDGTCNDGDLDDDDDGVEDPEDSDPLNQNVCRDVDADLCDDCSSGTDDPAGDGDDFDLDGLCDFGDPDDDNDGVEDGQDTAPFDDTLCRDADGDTCDDCSLGPATYVQVDFDIDESGFNYFDDTFRGTSEPNYADGARVDPGGFAGGALSVAVGGIDDLLVQGMSGGWQRTFALDAPSEVIVGFYYSLSQTAEYEPDEVSQALLSVDGVLYGESPDDFIAEISGDGDGGDPITTGWQYFEVNVGTLTQGSHTLTIGGFNSSKSLNDESTEVRFDDVVVLQWLGGARDNPANDGVDFDADGLCDAGDPDDDDDGVDDVEDSDPFDPFLCGDSDTDTCEDCTSGVSDPANDGDDFDTDGLCDAGDPDDDNDTVDDVDDDEPLNPNACRDTDADTCDDCSSGTDAPNDDGDDFDTDGLCDAGDPDDDNDNVDDVDDDEPFNANACRDVDADTCDDCTSGIDDPANDGDDFEGDGLCDAGDTDDDNDNVDDIDDDEPFNPNACRDADADTCDDCTSGIDDQANDGDDFDTDGLCDAGDPDDDNDNVDDGDDSEPFNPNACRDLDTDTCDDCTSGIDDQANDGDDFDTDGLCDAGDPDDDNDNVDDGDDSEPFNPNACRDLDTDTCDDCASGVDDPNDDGDDFDTDGLCDAGDPDDDNDNVDDGDDDEPLNPNACRDTDADTCDDCTSGTDAPNDDGDDFDTDGLCDLGDPDDDNDNVDDVDDDEPFNANACRDVDADTCDDCASGIDDPANDGDDFESDGLCDAGDPDDDNDNVDDVDDDEPFNPNACRDADADTCDDCSSGVDAPNADGDDFDSDGLCDAGDPDDDNDNVDDLDDDEPLNPNACRDLDTDTCDDCTSGIDDPANDGDDFDSDGTCDDGDLDDDNDNVDDVDDAEPFNSNACRDVDADTCDDCTSGIDDPANDGDDFDTDGLCDLGDPDDDNDNVDDIDDEEPLNANACRDLDADTCDDCTSGIDDPANDGDDFDEDGTCNDGDLDDDGDNVDDIDDEQPLNSNACRDLDADSCDDCSSGTDNPAGDGDDFDTDGLCDLGDPDDDNDNVDDLDDDEPLNPNACRDLDSDSCDDCSSGTDNPAGDGDDFDTDGLCDLGDPDDDNDGADDVNDDEPFNPFVCGDVDGDSCEDCVTGVFDPANDGDDFDADGLCDAGDPDDDNDGVIDGSDCEPFNIGVGLLPEPIGATLQLAKDAGTRLTWGRSVFGLTSNVYRGTIVPGAWAYDETCLEAEIPGTELTNPDTETPPSGEAFYYLVSGNNACGEGRIGVTSEGTELFASPSCPAQNLDTDEDGVLDVADNCPLHPDETLADLDMDLVGDVCDNCTADGNSDQLDTDADGPGDVCDDCTDLDDDGYGDPGFPANTCDLDNCPDLPNSGQENNDGDTRGNACDSCPDDAEDDFDGDGFCADVDNCDALANPDQLDADTDGDGDACDDCTDLDDDGYGDPGFPANTCDLDNCPALPNSGQEDADGDTRGNACDVCEGDPDDDLDGDGICAGSGFQDPKVGDGDNCPGTPNPFQENLDADPLGDHCDPCFANPDPGCVACADPDTDLDGDGVCNLDVPLTTFGPSGETVAVEFGSSMTYLANSADPAGLGMTWIAEDFDDVGWDGGFYGVGFENTSGAEDLILTPVSGDSVSAYTRTTFFVADVAAIAQLFVSADYDDGYVAWVNGVEVFRSLQIPAGPLDWDTLPSSLHESSNGATPFYGSPNDISELGIPALHAGDNVLAVAVWSPPDSSDMVLVPRLSWITESDMSWLANLEDPEIGLQWTELGFDDTDWGVGTYGIGYDTGGQAASLINTEVSEGSYSAYTRVEFDIADLGQVNMFSIGADYDDAYVAFVNGVEIYRSPDMHPTNTAWDARPLNQKDPSNAEVPDYGQLINVSDLALPALQQGPNVLAVGVWNIAPTSSDLVLAPRAAINGATWDNCPYVSNPGQADADGDGIGDDCEP